MIEDGSEISESVFINFYKFKNYLNPPLSRLKKQLARKLSNILLKISFGNTNTKELMIKLVGIFGEKNCLFKRGNTLKTSQKIIPYILYMFSTNLTVFYFKFKL